MHKQVFRINDGNRCIYTSLIKERKDLLCKISNKASSCTDYLSIPRAPLSSFVEQSPIQHFAFHPNS